MLMLNGLQFLHSDKLDSVERMMLQVSSANFDHQGEN